MEIGHLWSIFSELDTLCETLDKQKTLPLSLIVVLWGGQHYPHFTGEETESQSHDVIYQRSQNWRENPVSSSAPLLMIWAHTTLQG